MARFSTDSTWLCDLREADSGTAGIMSTRPSQAQSRDVAIKRAIQTLLWSLNPLNNLRRPILPHFRSPTHVFTIGEFDRSCVNPHETITEVHHSFAVLFSRLFSRHPSNLNWEPQKGSSKWDGV